MREELPLDLIDQLYDSDYYASDCDGHAEFQRGGQKLPRRLKKCVKLAQVAPGDRVVDVGCGRGELAVHAAQSGATVIAIDPSSDALRYLPRCNSLQVVRSRGEALPLPSGWATSIYLTDVVEHLPPRNLSATLNECRRVLAKSGRLVVHTQPNRILVD